MIEEKCHTKIETEKIEKRLLLGSGETCFYRNRHIMVTYFSVQTF